MSSTLGLAAFAALIVANALFVAGEFALVSADRSRVMLAAEQGSKRAQLVLQMLRRLSFHLSGTQVGVTVTSISLGFLSEPLLARLLRGPAERWLSPSAAEPVAVVLALMLTTVVQLLAAELVPKNIAVARAERTAMHLVPFIRGFNLVLAPVIFAFNATANWTVRRLGLEPRDEFDSIPNLEELDHYIRTSAASGTLDHSAHELLSRSIRFADKTAADVLVPRLEVVGLSEHATAAELAAAVAEHGYSRYPLFGDDRDDIVGVVLAKDLLKVAFADRATTIVGEFRRPVLEVPETQSLRTMLVQLRRRRIQLAVVIDEYGGTAGIMTLEDVIEELVGDIADEHDDVPEFSSGPQRPDVHVASFIDGDLDLDRVHDIIGVRIPPGPYETAAGFALVCLDRIPRVGERFVWEGWEFIVVEMDLLRIARLAVRALPSIEELPS